ncbi:hypothetical protein PACTADRAFT_77780 [Pachysolen tannophilus NRRL Y-2460]|uniref:Mitochondrial import inner membrane translocase subunit TIM44 n=1 Tax=Pachysolen tannophilus NRRL Y-2460 TaxID=669874 RepID=A0A1E4TP03_PACTA|nr:hypothetical protein PACTADRAFT_77780 [Pachysolen tannophilus NRRL Y-2460]
MLRNQLQRHNNNSPLKVFVDTFRKEWGKSQELKDNIKALQDETGRMAESEAFHKAKEAYDRAQKSRSVASQGLKKTAEVVGDAAVKAWESPVGKATRSTVKITAEVIDKSIDPLRNTAVYKEVSKVIDDGSSSRYGGFLTKEERQRKREELIKSGKRAKIIKSDEDAGTALIATKHKPTGPSWTDKITFLRPNTFLGKLLAELRFRYEETDNRLISTIRTIIEKIGGFFAETENGRVIRAFKDIDPSFNIEDFNTQLRDYIVPEVLDAYVQGDELILKKWFSEAPFNVVQAQQKAMKDQGLFSDGKILDIRGVDIVSAKILPPSNIPVLVIGCRAQEIQLFRDFKTGEIKAGTEENIMLSSYAMVITRIPEDVDNPDTEGWKILEFVRGGSRQFT